MNTRTPTVATDEGVVAMPFGIGDEVAVIRDCDDWASDWWDLRLWIAGVQAVHGGGFDYWVSDIWPLPEHPSLTDGFYMRVNGKADTLSLVARAAIAAIPMEGE